MDVAAHVSFWSLSFDHWRVSSDRYCAACYGSRFIIWSLKIEIASPFLSLSNLSVFVFVIFSQRKRQLIARKDQIFLRYICKVDLNPISCRFSSMTRWCLLSLVTGKCVFEMRNSLGDVSQRSERRAESDVANARKGKGRLLREVESRDAL